MADLAFDSSLVVLIDEEGLTCADVERRVAGVLTEQGYAKDTFAQAILDREANFPTALDMSGLNVAIPHCDVANVNKAAFCMAVLKNPVEWHKMTTRRTPARSPSWSCSPSPRRTPTSTCSRRSSASSRTRSSSRRSSPPRLPSRRLSSCLPSSPN